MRHCCQQLPCSSAATGRDWLPLPLIIAALLFCMAPLAEAFTIEWGDGPARLGLINQPETERTGPLTFAVTPRHSLAVADTVHRELKEFADNGRYIRTIARDVRPSSIAFDADGNYLLLDDHTVEVRTPTGNLLRVLTVPGQVQLVEGYGQEVFAEDGMIGVNDPDENVFLFGADNDHPTKPTTVGKGRKSLGGDRVFTQRLGQQVTLQQHGSGNVAQKLEAVSAVSAINPEAGARQPGAVIFRGASPSGALFAEVEECETTSTHLKAKRFEAGRIAADVELPNQYFTTVYRKFTVEPDGTIWQMQTTPSGVEFTTRSMAK